MKLSKMLAKACMYAQEHIDDKDAWPTDKETRENLLQCTSFQVACFLAQNTVHGKHGVEWSIVIDALIEYPMKSEKEWQTIIDSLAKDHGGWNKK